MKSLNARRVRRWTMTATSTEPVRPTSRKARISLVRSECIAGFYGLIASGETVAGTVHRLDIFWIGGVRLDLGAQVADVDINRALIAFIGAALQPVEQLQTGEDPPWRCHQR